ncbi:MAG: hypothetical protein IPJ78_16360 [Gemmatimonadetes bacterium]|nr:hypothetical protein [Gemmatimonadota bacterium]
MRSLRALVAAACLLVGPAVQRLEAQAGWNDERTRTLVTAAIVRRAAQLADTGLADYTARAHGYVTFLAQLGDGFPTPPVVIKSDELMLEVYWGAPDRSKQRIIGRRDTLLLPTDINYHRDHLAIVQNNFPAIIRLGDGDEVRDVRHPLSAAGFESYDYRIVDSLTIRTGDRVIDVMQVNVRPKDDREPAAVGAVFIDRRTASVVRMSFSFTRAALKDRQLEDVSVILENGLVDGRFWLPRRQEIEIRRSATWMDFPARGIIRGRWEICCIETNAGLAPQQFIGPEIVEAPRAQQRAFAFDGELLKQLPEEVRALDAIEVRRVQEEARAMVRAGALARARNGAPAARSVSDLVRVNRVEGLAFGGGFAQSLGGGFRTSLHGRYGLADSRWKGRGVLAWESASGARTFLEGRDEFAEAGVTPEVSGIRNSIAAQEFGSDWTDPYGIRGGLFRYEFAPVGRRRLSLEYAREDQRPLAVHGAPTAGRFAPTLAADAVRLSRLAVDWSRAPAPDGGDRRLTLGGRFSVEESHPAGGQLGTRYARAVAELEGARAWAGGRLLVRTHLGAVTPGSGVPLQALPAFGGPVTAPGYAFHAIRGRAGLAQRIEWQRRVPFLAMDLGRFGKVPSSLVLAPFVHGAAMRDGAGDWSSYPSAGVGIIGFFDLLRIDVARTLRGGRWMVSVDASREFWNVL